MEGFLANIIKYMKTTYIDGSPSSLEKRGGEKYKNSQESLIYKIANISCNLLSSYVFSLPHLALKHSLKYKHTILYHVSKRG